MTTQQIITNLKDAKSDLDVAYRLFRKGNEEEAKELLAKCFEIRMSVYGGISEVIRLMEQFDSSFNELYFMFNTPQNVHPLLIHPGVTPVS